MDARAIRARLVVSREIRISRLKADLVSSMHRADYHRALINEARRLGARIRLDCDVVTVNCDEPYVVLSTGEKIVADVIIGADGTCVCPLAGYCLRATGLRSCIRDEIVGKHIDPEETGDLAYRVTIPSSRVDELRLQDPSLDELLKGSGAHHLWMGPLRHAVLYPIRHCKIYNLVLVSVSRSKEKTCLC